MLNLTIGQIALIILEKGSRHAVVFRLPSSIYSMNITDKGGAIMNKGIFINLTMIITEILSEIIKAVSKNEKLNEIAKKSQVKKFHRRI